MAIKDLSELMKNMNSELFGTEYVFVKVDADINMKLNPKMIFREEEGVTLILERSQADSQNLKYDAVWNMITLRVNSDLEAVGFLVKICEALAKEKISVNAVSAFCHDHLFVLEKDSKKVLDVLKRL